MEEQDEAAAASESAREGMKLASALHCVVWLTRTSAALLRTLLLAPRRLPQLCQAVLDHHVQTTTPELTHRTLEEFLTYQYDLRDAVDIDAALPIVVGERNVTLGEALVLSALVKATRARRVLEIGTFRGWTSYLLASAVGTGGEVLTLDLPPRTKTGYPVEKRDVYGLSEADVGSTFKTLPLHGAEVIQLWGDSATFDFSPWEGGIDMVLVDGAHTKEYVRNDTARALDVARDGGLVVWHDLKSSCPGVISVLSELGRRLDLCHIVGTSLVVHVKRPQPGVSGGKAAPRPPLATGAP